MLVLAGGFLLKNKSNYITLQMVLKSPNYLKTIGNVERNDKTRPIYAF